MKTTHPIKNYVLAAVFSAAAVWALAPATAFAQDPVLEPCPEDQTAVIGTLPAMECTSASGTDVQLDGTGSSVGTNITYLWTNDGGVIFDDDMSLTPMGTFPLGTTEVTLTVSCTDDLGTVDVPVMMDVVIQDTTPPTLDAVADRTCLWPPNHKLHKITVAADAQDICDPSPAVTLTSAVSNEPDNSNGDGNTVGDVQGADVGTDDSMFKLRSERRGPGSGRVYSITYTATDASLNTTDDVVMIDVPHDMSDSEAREACKKVKLQGNNGKAGLSKAEKNALKAERNAAKAAQKAAKAAAKAAQKAAKQAAKGAK